MSARDGDGWIQCQCGSPHWGLHGAAGLLLVRDQKILLQHRAPWVHNGDTWGIPGGAKDSHESILEGATREAREEIGIFPATFTPVHIHTDDHGDWRYDTIIARAHEDLIPHELNDESQEVEWVEVAQVNQRTLHPAFAKHWPALYGLLYQLGLVSTSSNSE